MMLNSIEWQEKRKLLKKRFLKVMKLLIELLVMLTASTMLKLKPITSLTFKLVPLVQSMKLKNS